MLDLRFGYIIRNLGRKKKQTLFTILCLSISSFIVLGNLAMNNGLQYKLKEGINQAISGQLTIYETASSNINILESQLKELHPFLLPDEWTVKMKNEGNLTIDKRIRFGSLISYDDETSWVNVQALESDHLTRLQNLLSLQEGKMPHSGKQILISETTADELKCQTGDTLLLLANNLYDYTSDEVGVVVGIFEEKGMSLFLNYSAFVIYDFGEELVQLGNDEYLELVVNSKDNTAIPEKMISEIRTETLSISPEIKVAQWEQTVPLFYKIVQVWKGGGYFTQIIFIAFSLLILINLTMLIIGSRKKEFGTLLTFGFTWLQIRLMLAAEYLLLTLFSVLLSLMALLLLVAGMADPGIPITTPDMQSALMTDYLPLLIDSRDFFYTLGLFSLTTLTAVWISISRIQEIAPVVLIHK